VSSPTLDKRSPNSISRTGLWATKGAAMLNQMTLGKKSAQVNVEVLVRIQDFEITSKD
jgi:hypothetical protein